MNMIGLDCPLIGLNRQLIWIQWGYVALYLLKSTTYVSNHEACNTFPTCAHKNTTFLYRDGLQLETVFYKPKCHGNLSNTDAAYMHAKSRSPNCGPRQGWITSPKKEKRKIPKQSINDHQIGKIRSPTLVRKIT